MESGKKAKPGKILLSENHIASLRTPSLMWDSENDPFQVFEVDHQPCIDLKIVVTNGEKITKGFYRDLLDMPDPYVVLKVAGSSNSSKRTSHVDNNINPIWDETFHFYLDPRKDSILEIILMDANHFQDGEIGREKLEVNLLVLNIESEFTFTFNGTSKVNAILLATKNQTPDLRFSIALCEEEKKFLRIRREKILEHYKNFFDEHAPRNKNEVPIMAVLGSGGGFRAMICFAAAIKVLQESGIMDCATYVAGLSGSSWFLSTLYAHDLFPKVPFNQIYDEIKESATKNWKWNLLNSHRYFADMMYKSRNGQPVAFTDIFGHLLGDVLLKGKKEKKLSDQRQVLSNGSVPMPLYTSLHVKESVSCKAFSEWVEFSPYEIGIAKYGTFMRSEIFGSKFLLGKMIKNFSEFPLHYLQGVWGSAFTVLMKQLVQHGHSNNVQNAVRHINEERDVHEQLENMCLIEDAQNSPNQSLSDTDDESEIDGADDEFFDTDELDFNLEFKAENGNIETENENWSFGIENGIVRNENRKLGIKSNALSNGSKTENDFGKIENNFSLNPIKENPATKEEKYRTIPKGFTFDLPKSFTFDFPKVSKFEPRRKSYDCVESLAGTTDLEINNKLENRGVGKSDKLERLNLENRNNKKNIQNKSYSALENKNQLNDKKDKNGNNINKKIVSFFKTGNETNLKRQDAVREIKRNSLENVEIKRQPSDYWKKRRIYRRTIKDKKKVPAFQNWLKNTGMLKSRSGRAGEILNPFRGLSLRNSFPISPFTDLTYHNEDQDDVTDSTSIGPRCRYEPLDHTAKNLYIIDSGLAFNSPYPILLRPQRAVDMYLSFDFSQRPSDRSMPFKELILAEKWAKQNKVLFPPVAKLAQEFEMEGPVRELYVFKDPNDPLCPVILHFTIINNLFKWYKEPGVFRKTKEDIEFGDFSVFDDPNSPYASLNFVYDQLSFERLFKLVEFNTLLNIQKIKNEIQEQILKKRELLKKHASDTLQKLQKIHECCSKFKRIGNLSLKVNENVKKNLILACKSETYASNFNSSTSNTFVGVFGKTRVDKTVSTSSNGSFFSTLSSNFSENEEYTSNLEEKTHL